MEKVEQTDILKIKDVEEKYNCFISCIMQQIKGKTLSEGIEIMNKFKNTFTDTDIKFEIIDNVGKGFFNNGINKCVLYYYKEHKPKYAAIGYIKKENKDCIEWISYPFISMSFDDKSYSKK